MNLRDELNEINDRQKAIVDHKELLHILLKPLLKRYFTALNELRAAQAHGRACRYETNYESDEWRITEDEVFEARCLFDSYEDFEEWMPCDLNILLDEEKLAEFENECTEKAAAINQQREDRKMDAERKEFERLRAKFNPGE